MVLDGETGPKGDELAVLEFTIKLGTYECALQISCDLGLPGVKYFGSPGSFNSLIENESRYNQDGKNLFPC
jgi:hypothetical protein